MPSDQDSSVQEVHAKVEKAYAASLKYRRYTQSQVDQAVEAAAAAGRANAQRLAELAVQETRYGNVRDKVAKNLLNADLLPRAMRGMKTVGLLREVPDRKMIEVGVPVGVVAALVPTTNPTSTVIFKSLISLKSGNAVVISPHPRAVRCTYETAQLLHRAAVDAGAPPDIIQCLEKPTGEAIHALMHHERTGVILATGGSAMVRAAYSSGKPAFGVGPGNVPVLLDTSADVRDAVAKVVDGKSFDYGTVCSSEQALIAEESLRQAVLGELKARKAFLCDDAQKAALARTLLKENFRINPECVGQSPTRIAEMAGFSVPPDTSILVVELQGVGKQHPLSVEKLSPVLALYFVRDFAAGLDTCEALLRFGGLGHTCVIFSKDDARVREFGLRMPAMRVLVNTSAPQGSTGITTNLFPSMTLGCGAMAGNITSDNVGPQHLINIKRVAWFARNAEDVLKIPPLVEAVAAPRPAAPAIDQQVLVAAVEQYLKERGFTLVGGKFQAPPAISEPRAQAHFAAAAAAGSTAAAVPAPAPASAPEPPVRSAVVANVAAQVVDRFLAVRRASNPAPAPAASPVEPSSQPAAASPEPPQPAPESEPLKPGIAIVDFVCENDVRAAMQQSRKIFIGRKTIVTPAARELADQHDILVMTQR